MKKEATSICTVRIGFDYWLMPEAQAMRVFSALRGARRVERDYQHGRTVWNLLDDSERGRVEIAAVPERDIINPQTRRPKLIEG